MAIKEPIITKQALEMPAPQSILYILLDIDHIIPFGADEIITIEDIIVLLLKSSYLDDLIMFYFHLYIIFSEVSIIASNHNLTINYIVLGFPGSLLFLLLLEVFIENHSGEVFAAVVLCCITAL